MDMTEFIKTKLLFEYKKGQMIGLGFGNIINSDADVLILSAFSEPSFTPNSTIGALNEYLIKKSNINLSELIDDELQRKGYQVIDLSSRGLSLKKILLVNMGSRDLFRTSNKEDLAELVLNSLKQGLEKAGNFLSGDGNLFTLDVTALGTKYGGVKRKECFDMLINWATDLFASTKNITFLRFVSFDLDTFVDFFESIYRLKKIKPEQELTFSADYDIDKYSSFKQEISSALRNLDENPRGVIITCRSIIETIVKFRVKDNTVKLADGISLLKGATPPSIYSYLTTCRLLGNFSNHDPDFIPTRRDAEGILLLTLRIVEWHLANSNPN